MFTNNPNIEALNKELDSSIKGEGLSVVMQQPLLNILQISLKGELSDKSAIRICEFCESLVQKNKASDFLKIILDVSGIAHLSDNSGELILDKLKSLAFRNSFQEISIILKGWMWRLKAKVALFGIGKSKLYVHKSLNEALKDLSLDKSNAVLKFKSDDNESEDFGNIMHAFRDHDIRSDEEWGFKDEEDGFDCEFKILNKNILIGYASGNMDSLQAIAFIHRKKEASSHLRGGNNYFLLDIKGINKISRRARRILLDNEQVLSEKFEKSFLIAKAEFKSLFFLQKSSQPNTFKNFQLIHSYKEGLRLIQNPENRDNEENKIPQVANEYLNKINALASAINSNKWNETLLADLQLKEDDPFRVLFDGIKILKSDMEENFQKALSTNISLENIVDEHTEEITTKESNLRSILDNTDDEIYLINNRYELIDYNNNFENNFYARYGVFVEKGRNIFSMMPPEYKDLESKMRDRIDKALQGHQRTYYDKFNLGYYESTAELKFFPIKSSTRQITGVSIFVRDCTEQKRSEDIIHQNQLLLSSINRNIKEGLYRSTPARGMIYVNQAFVEMFGFDTEEEALLSPSGSLYDDTEGRNRLVKLIEEFGSFTNEEVRFRKKDGTPFWGLLSSMRSIDSEGNVFYDGSIRDITHIKEYESEIIKSKEIAENATRAKSDFLATMSHEIRTPMNGVIGMTSLLADTKLTTQQKDFVDTIKVSGEHLLNIINDILDFSKIEAGALELENSVFDLNSCIEEVMNLFSGRAYEKNIELFYRVTNSEVLQLNGDVTRLRQVIVNLIGNAIKFTENGEVIIDVEINERKNDKVKLTISVIDTGIGIPQDKLHRLFKPFSQLDNSTTRKYGGTGLGLAISQRLVDLMEGDLRVESAIGKGTRFFFDLTLQESELEEKRQTDIQILKGKKIIIVDDNRTNRKILEQLFITNGMEVESFDSPTIALSIVSQGKQYDLGLIDMKMPEMDGIAFAKALYKEEKGRNIPLILYSSIGHMLSRTDINKYFKAHVSKPIRHDVLLKRMSEILTPDKFPKQKNEIKQESVSTNIANEYPIKILLAEDNLINQKLAEQVLAMFGYTVSIAENGKVALEMMKTGAFELVFMDVMMPEMDGLEATKNIRLLDTISQPVIIAMTANALKGDKEKCIASGMDDYVSKPIDVEQIGKLLYQYGKQIMNSKT